MSRKCQERLLSMKQPYQCPLNKIASPSVKTSKSAAFSFKNFEVRIILDNTLAVERSASLQSWHLMLWLVFTIKLLSVARLPFLAYLHRILPAQPHAKDIFNILDSWCSSTTSCSNAAASLLGSITTVSITSIGWTIKVTCILTLALWAPRYQCLFNRHVNPSLKMARLKDLNL